jgi:hypothetical protein
MHAMDEVATRFSEEKQKPLMKLTPSKIGDVAHE